MPPLLSLMDLLPDPSSFGQQALRVETGTLLPGGGVVTVAVRHAPGGFEVDDEAGGRGALLSLGVSDLSRGDTRRGNELAASGGLLFDGERFRAVEVSGDRLLSAIAYVADACRAWTAGALEARTRRTERDLAERSLQQLRSIFPSFAIDRDRELSGASTKKHRFDIIVTLPGDRFAMFEMLAPSAASVAAAHLKFYDLLQAQAAWPREAVVEDLSGWPADDLAIMQQVATHVRGLDSSWTDIEKLAA